MADNFWNISKGISLNPQASDPLNPTDGDVYYSDGTFRAKGVWQYKDAAWVVGGSGTGGMASGSTTSVKTADYTIVDSDKGKIVLVDSTTGPIDITLPAPTAGFVVTVKDSVGLAATNNIVVLPVSPATLDTTDGLDVLNLGYQAVTYLADGTNWARISYFEGASPGQRAILGLGFSVSLGSISVNSMDYFNISVLGNAADFGDLTVARYSVGAVSSSTRGVWASGDTAGGGSGVATMDYVTIATLGNGINFGNISVTRNALSGCGSSTRGVFGGGLTSGVGTYRNTIDYITIATTGNAVNFGILTLARGQSTACSNSTRGIWAGGNTPTKQTTIDYITIATTGNATSFGALVEAKTEQFSCSSNTRGVFAGGNGAVNYKTVIEYVTIATTGNTTNFGSLTVGRSSAGGTSSTIRGVFIGGNTGADSNVIDYVTIATTGNAIDFGDMFQARYFGAAVSDCHGGI